ncbi:MAG: UDP-N-acetylmuramoyl-L-alanine--D-glutamate ligase [Bacteroidetes bacterium]|nr:UDP-N-acetylmuramoyl-L-alanine--D-glutamate ligase [Bacteroidota bacterium]MBM3424074.1 UDP-N-acetylmuramoyl-L-alanine--D-glutamate ligase [Bacteroidota bacterium]
MGYNYHHIVVLGAAESGQGAAVLAKSKGFSVFVSESKGLSRETREFLIEEGISFEENGHTLEKILEATLVVKSPGIPGDIPLVQSILSSGIPVVSEIEFARPFSKGKTVCITGSNGKTTTALWIFHILKKAGLNVALAGNIGASYAKEVAQNDADWFVLELSSFQLDDMYEFKADIAVLTNISPDHLDRYNYQMDRYINAKLRILQNMDESCFFIYNADDIAVVEALSRISSSAVFAPFSITKAIDFGGYIQHENLIINIKTTTTMSIHELALKGKHNAQNALAAGIAARLLEIRPELVRESLTDFENVEHRLEFVAKVHGVEFINDSKATNINAAWYALESMERPTVWIVGGVDKGNDYSELIELVKSKVKAIVCLGLENQKIIEVFTPVAECIVETRSAGEAVKAAFKLAGAGSTVLLSPACASFDLFKNYEDRGIQFKKAVRNL